MTKTEQNKKHYEKNRVALKEKAREQRLHNNKLKTFGELMQELADATQISESKFLESVVEQTELKPFEVASAYKKMREDLSLTQHQRSHIHNNIPAKKALLERLDDYEKSKK